MIKPWIEQTLTVIKETVNVNYIKLLDIGICIMYYVDKEKYR